MACVFTPGPPRVGDSDDEEDGFFALVADPGGTRVRKGVRGGGDERAC